MLQSLQRQSKGNRTSYRRTVLPPTFHVHPPIIEVSCHPKTSSRRHHIIHIDFHGSSLLNDSDSQHEAVAFIFAQENPVHSLQRTSDHFNVHAFMQVRMRVVGQHTRHQ